MNSLLDDLIIDINKIDLNDIYTCWNWLLPVGSKVVMISKIGDMFLRGQDNRIYWLATDTGELTVIASNHTEFLTYLSNEDKLDNWFLPPLIEDLIKAKKFLASNQVYGFIKMPVLGGEYEINNITPTDINVHFAITGQIFEQIKNLPNGTSISIKFKD